MRRKILPVFNVGMRFRREFRRQLRMLIVVTLGFTIAFSWRQTTFDLSQSFIQWITKTQNSSLSTILTSIFITLLSILLIVGTSNFFKDGENNGYDY